MARPSEMPFRSRRTPTLRPDGRAVLPRDEHYCDESCPHPACGALYGRERHTGDCRANVLEEIRPHAQETANKWHEPIILFQMRHTGRWHMAVESWWKERLRHEVNFAQYQVVRPEDRKS